MKKIKIEDAVGMPLCHDITEMKGGFKGPAFKRGHILTEEDIPKLLDLGKKTVFIWEENAGEIHEEEAAIRLSIAARTENAHYTGPSEGKMQLIVPESLQSILDAIGLADGASLNVNDLISLLTNEVLTGILGEWGITSELVATLEEVLNAINEVVETNNLRVAWVT